jgi:hypothetical protein
MNLLKRVRYVLGLRPVQDGGAWQSVGLAAMVLPAAVWGVCIALVCLTPQTVQAQETQKAEGERPPGADKGKPEDALRQRDLLEMIKELQDEVRQLRREVDQLKAEKAAGHTRERGEGEVSARKEAKERKKKGHKGEETVLLKSSGVIKEVTRDGKAQKVIFTVKEDGKEMEMTCVLGEATQITLNDKEAQFDDLKPGDYVECEYVLKGEKMVAVARTVTAKRGTVLEKGK